MEVQVFGTRKCKDTQKALRFFKERRSDDQLEALTTAHREVTVDRIPGVNHYTVLLSERGADAVAERVSSRLAV